jgi:hypothetical protein
MNFIARFFFLLATLLEYCCVCFLTQSLSLSSSLTFSQDGSTARDHLANERTFLAWSTLGLAFMGAGTGLYSAYNFTAPPVVSNRSDKDEAAVVAIQPVEVIPACGLLVMNVSAVNARSLLSHSSISPSFISLSRPTLLISISLFTFTTTTAGSWTTLLCASTIHACTRSSAER